MDNLEKLFLTSRFRIRWSSTNMFQSSDFLLFSLYEFTLPHITCPLFAVVSKLIDNNLVLPRCTWTSIDTASMQRWNLGIVKLSSFTWNIIENRGSPRPPSEQSRRSLMNWNDSIQITNHHQFHLACSSHLHSFRLQPFKIWEESVEALWKYDNRHSKDYNYFYNKSWHTFLR